MLKEEEWEWNVERERVDEIIGERLNTDGKVNVE